MPNAVFEGENAIRDFLNPDNHVIPLVEITSILKTEIPARTRIFAKIMGALPLHNQKSLPAFNMYEEAERKGKLAGVNEADEASSGNTVLSEGAIGPSFGITRTNAYVSHQVEKGKLQMLRLFGIHPKVVVEDICPDPSDPGSAINLARAAGALPGHFNPGQFDNPDNPGAHARWTGPQIWRQRPDISVFCSGLGTSGAFTGTSQFLKDCNPSVTAVGVLRAPNNPMPGVRTRNQMDEIEFEWERWLEACVEIGTVAGYERSKQLCQKGLVVGPSSGFALEGLIAFLHDREEKRLLDELRNANGEIVAVFICPDTPYPYLEEYFRYLGEQSFPPIEGEMLLERREPMSTPTHAAEADIEARTLLRSAYRDKAELLWNKVKKPMENEEELLSGEMLLIDLRTVQEFRDHHLPGSLPLNITDAARTIQMWNLLMERLCARPERIVFICKAGFLSRHIALRAQESGVRALSLQGGTMEWSRLGLPRVIHPNCIPENQQIK